MKRGNVLTLILLHVLLAVYSSGEIFSKLASSTDFLSFKFCFYYGLVIFMLVIYAIGWQQIIKKMPLTTAFANKAVSVVWGIVWGALVFHESITPGKIAGAILVIAGVVLFAKAGDGHEN